MRARLRGNAALPKFNEIKILTGTCSWRGVSCKIQVIFFHKGSWIDNSGYSIVVPMDYIEELINKNFEKKK